MSSSSACTSSRAPSVTETVARTVERLVEMVSWRSPSKQRVRALTAENELRLAGKGRNVLRIVTIPGAIESVSTMLETSNNGDHFDLALNEMGLHIMKKLAREHGNSAKICSTRGVPSRIIYFTGTTKSALQNAEGSLLTKTVIQSPQVGKNLSGTPGHTGEAIRKEISKDRIIEGFEQASTIESHFNKSKLKKFIRFIQAKVLHPAKGSSVLLTYC